MSDDQIENDGFPAISTGKRVLYSGCLPAILAPLILALAWAFLLRDALTQTGPTLAPLAVVIPAVFCGLPSGFVAFLLSLWRFRKREFYTHGEALKAGMKFALCVCGIAAVILFILMWGGEGM